MMYLLDLGFKDPSVSKAYRKGEFYYRIGTRLVTTAIARHYSNYTLEFFELSAWRRPAL